jgi:hypothetical protein
MYFPGHTLLNMWCIMRAEVCGLSSRVDNRFGSKAIARGCRQIFSAEMGAFRDDDACCTAAVTFRLVLPAIVSVEEGMMR